MDIDTDQRSQTIAEFCQHERISKTTFYKLRAAGLGPNELRLPNSAVVRITPEAREAWRVRMTEIAKTEAAQLEVERRRELAAVAGRIAAESPLHVSRRQAGRLPERQPRRRR